METPLANDGGEAGGNVPDEPVPRLILKRSELAILRRMSDRYPIVEGERREVVETVMDIVRNAKSKRLKIAASKTMASLDKVNLDEMKTYLLAQKIVADDLKPAASVNVEVNNTIAMTWNDIYAQTRPKNRVEEEIAALNATETNGKPH